jgi:glyoxylase-like metal-dependent hydrolase (beta-lactamase superfamily II)
LAGSLFSSPDIHQIALPLPFAFGSVNAYLVRLASGFLLVDCGMDTEPCIAAWNAARDRLGFSWTDVRQVLLTHMHPDHAGLTARILEWSGAELLMHREELRLLEETTVTDDRNQWQEAALRRVGAPDEVRAKVRASFGALRRALRPLTPDRVLDGGETIPTAAGGLEVLWTRGHSRGHVVLYHRPSHSLLAGDQMLESITPNIGWESDHDALEEYLRALDRISGYDVEWILPGHGSAFQGHRQWIHDVKKHHSERCRRLESLLAAGPAHAHDLVSRLWPRPLTPLDYRFAAFEVFAHLHYLARRGRLAAEPGQDPMIWRLGCASSMPANKMRSSLTLSSTEKDYV